MLANGLGYRATQKAEAPPFLNSSSAAREEIEMDGGGEDDDAATQKIPTMELRKAIHSAPTAAAMPTGLQSGMKRKRVSFSNKENQPLLINAAKSSSREKTEKPKRGLCETAPPPAIAHLAPPTPTVASMPSNQISSIQSDQVFSLNGEQFIALKLLGKGGSSTVHRVISCKDGSLYALKRIDIRDSEDADEVFDSYANEISLLQSLKGSSDYIIDLVAFETHRDQRQLKLLLEAGDIDLAKLLSQRLKSSPEKGFLDPLFARMIWKEMLLAVDHIHNHRIVHGDLKPANFVFVKGHLKLIDFGIAKCISADTTNIYRDSQVGTVNYMAPEAIAPTSFLDGMEEHGKVMKLGKASDIWSLGCILYQMLYTRPPFALLTTVQKLTTIPNPACAINYPEHQDIEGVQVVQACLIRDPKQRKPIAGPDGLLAMPYLQPGTKITACTAVDSNESNATHNSEDVVCCLLQIVQAEAQATHPAAKQFIDHWFGSLDTGAIAAKLPRLLLSARSMGFEEDKQEEAIRRQMDSAVQTDLSDFTPPAEDSERTEDADCKAAKLLRGPCLGGSQARATIPEESSVKVLPADVRREILGIPSRSILVPVASQEGEERAKKWVRASQPVEDDMRTMLEKRMGEMRRFIDLDQDDATATETLDITSFTRFR